MISNGAVKIFGADDATSALIQTEFQELSPVQNSTDNENHCVLATFYGGEMVHLDDALEKIASYLNALDQQDYAIVSAFKDDLPVPESQIGPCKMYVWTLQK